MVWSPHFGHGNDTAPWSFDTDFFVELQIVILVHPTKYFIKFPGFMKV